MSSWVKVGAKCVCIGEFPPEINDPAGVVKGSVYTIEAICPCECGGDALLFMEVARNDSLGNETFWCSSHFRPLVEEYDDIALFTEIARTAKIDATTEQLERAWRESEHVIADDQSLRWIEEHRK